MSDTASELANLIAQHRPAVAGDAFPPWLRDRVGAHVAERLGRGVAIAALRAELGVSTTTLRRWLLQERRSPTSGGFAQVMVAPTEAAPTPSSAAPAPQISAATQAVSQPAEAGLYLVSPSGFTLRGLSFEQCLRAMMALQ